ncbi:MAG: hypothetical protein CMQ14_03835 [Gammaproteobacteria bacterium]|nr:hypothetical protein [Gammaproteobacteria bacterium]
MWKFKLSNKTKSWLAFALVKQPLNKAEQTLNALVVQLQSEFAVPRILVQQDHCQQRRTTGLVSVTPCAGDENRRIWQ